VIREVVEQLLTELVGELPAGHDLEFVKDPKHGDVASNVAFLLARAQGRDPAGIAGELAGKLSGRPEFSQVNVGGRGFINFTIADPWLVQGIQAAASPDFGRSTLGQGSRVLVEYVSANPTGPLVIANARAGALGSALISILRFTGHDAVGEFYINDSGHQIELFGQSVAARVAEQRGEPLAVPEGGYPGGYLVPIAEDIVVQNLSPDQWGSFALEALLAGQRRTLERFGLIFDSFVRESTIRPSNPEILDRLAAAGLSYVKDGATWFRAEQFGDTEDRVLVKSNGEPSYALTDINYHCQKLERGFARLITIWGADHHGDIARLKGGLKALGYPPERLEILITQWTTLLRDGQKLGMSKRAGTYITIDEVLDEIGVDALKFYLLMRRASQHLEFDLALAKKTSAENPVYYAQYGHARIASIVRFAQEKGIDPEAQPARWEFRAPEERALAKMVMRYPDVVESAARALEPHRLVYYTLDLANTFHTFYEGVRVVSDDPAATGFRVYLCQCTRKTIRSALNLIGVSAPERMER
jgi:arginyl-tRNA synthetase